eukprot:7219930-Pyramimonas_sp.AAC.1
MEKEGRWGKRARGSGGHDGKDEEGRCGGARQRTFEKSGIIRSIVITITVIIIIVIIVIIGIPRIIPSSLSPASSHHR